MHATFDIVWFAETNAQMILIIAQATWSQMISSSLQEFSCIAQHCIWKPAGSIGSICTPIWIPSIHQQNSTFTLHWVYEIHHPLYTASVSTRAKNYMQDLSVNHRFWEGFLASVLRLPSTASDAVPSLTISSTKIFPSADHKRSTILVSEVFIGT